MKYFLLNDQARSLTFLDTVKTEANAILALDIFKKQVYRTSNLSLYSLDDDGVWSLYDNEGSFVSDFSVAESLFNTIGLENTTYEDNAKKLEDALERIQELETAIQSVKNDASTTMERSLRRS